MRPGDIQPAKPVVPVRRRWYTPERRHDEADQPAKPPPPPPAVDDDDPHIDEYA